MHQEGIQQGEHRRPSIWWSQCDSMWRFPSISTSRKQKDSSALLLSPCDMRCIAVKSSVPQGMFVCFDKEVGWCVGIAVILVCREGPMR
jgi:hypothetical protein